MQDGVSQILYKMDNIQHNLKDKKKKFTTYIEQTQKQAGDKNHRPPYIHHTRLANSGACDTPPGELSGYD